MDIDKLFQEIYNKYPLYAFIITTKGCAPCPMPSFSRPDPGGSRHIVSWRQGCGLHSPCPVADTIMLCGKPPAISGTRGMLVHEGATRSIGTDLRLGCTLAAAAGAVNVAGFLAVGYYTANMTGNLSALAAGVGDGGMMSVLACMGVLAAFVAGGCMAALLVGAGRRRGVRAVHAACIALEGTLLIALGVLSRVLPAWVEAGGLGCGLGFLMGLQNATVTHISGARVRTTHMTGMLTDLGMELGQWLLDPGAARVRERLRLHGAIIACFVLGGIGGAVGYRAYGIGVLAFMGGGLVALALPGLWQAARRG